MINEQNSDNRLIEITKGRPQIKTRLKIYFLSSIGVGVYVLYYTL